jgi:phosphate transport system permease protein
MDRGFSTLPGRVSTLAPRKPNPAQSKQAVLDRLNATDRRANRALRLLALAGGALVFLALVAIVYQVIDGASLAFSKYGFGFIGHKTWNPPANQYGGLTFIYGTLVTAVGSLILATILGVSIGLFLSLMAPRRVAMVIGPLVEMLAAIPSVVLGLIGIYLLLPFIRSDVEPALHSVLGFTQIFGPPQPVGNSPFAAILVLTIMVVPIIAALTRDLFLTVPRELRDGAEALGCTRWEMIRGVVLPTTQSGIIAACVLGFGRALGEAIAVALVIGGVAAMHLNLFQGGYSMAAVLANEAPSAISALQTSSLFYLAAILLAMGITTNMAAQRISSRAGRIR